jgi:hypothetical protein
LVDYRVGSMMPRTKDGETAKVHMRQCTSLGVAADRLFGLVKAFSGTSAESMLWHRLFLVAARPRASRRVKRKRQERGGLAPRSDTDCARSRLVKLAC